MKGGHKTKEKEDVFCRGTKGLVGADFYNKKKKDAKPHPRPLLRRSLPLS